VAKVAWLIDETLKSLTNIVEIIGSLTGLNSKFAEPWQVKDTYIYIYILIRKSLIFNKLYYCFHLFGRLLTTGLGDTTSHILILFK